MQEYNIKQRELPQAKCGIVGYVGNEDCGTFLYEGLLILQNRGYDSAGIAVFENGKILNG